MSSLFNEARLQRTPPSLRSQKCIESLAIREVGAHVAYESRGHDGGYELVSDARMWLCFR